MSAKQTWSIIVFCFNEGENLQPVIEAAQRVLADLSTNESELIVVDDGSTDHTSATVQRLIERYPNLVSIRHAANRGIGQALQSGYRAARFENICAIPGDGQFDVRELLPFAEPPEDTIIAFYRENNEWYSYWRKALSWFNRQLNALFLGIQLRDVNWIKIYKRKNIDSISFKMNSSLVESEIVAKLLHHKIRLLEVPSKYQARAFGQAKGASPKIVFQAIKDLRALNQVIRKYKKSCFE